MIISELEKRRSYLQTVRHTLEENLTQAPDGALRISHCRNKPQYYVKHGPGNGLYLDAEKTDLVKRLAQKSYDQKALMAVTRELNAIEAYLSLLPAVTAEHLFDGLTDERKALVRPFAEPDDVFMKRWQAVSYPRKPFSDDDPYYYNKRGERMRSKSEVMISDMLDEGGNPNHYEFPVKLKGYGTVHPDFMILHKRSRKVILWEHCGKMDDPDYVNYALRKLNAYYLNGYKPGDNLIITWESSHCPADFRVLQNIVDHLQD